MRRRIATVALTAAAGVAAVLPITGGAAHAYQGNPAGETLPACDDAYGNYMTDAPCVNRDGWGVSVMRADGTQTSNYGPADYTYTGKAEDGTEWFYFHSNASTYGPAEYPKGDY